MKTICTFVLVMGSAAGLYASELPDSITFGNQKSEKTHSVEATGLVSVETLTTELGAIKRDYSVRTLRQTGATLSFDLTVKPDGKPVVLEIQEIHNRRPDVFGYTVLVNDQEVYFRTYYEIAAGPNHYFVMVPTTVIGSSPFLRITLRNEGNGVFSIGQVWAYANFFQGIAKEEQVFRTMPVLFDPRTQFTEPWEELDRIGSDLDYAIEKVKDYQARYVDTTCYGPVGINWGWGFSYGLHGPAFVSKLADHCLHLASAAQAPMTMSFNGLWWAGAPQGPDGIGGYFSDLKYHQGRYERDTDTYTYHTGFGGGFIARTFNSAPLLQMRKVRFKSAMQHIADRIAYLKAKGKEPPFLAFTRCCGEDYTPGGDFGAAITATAKADGVILNPEDGLSDKELDWMDRNLVRYLKEIALNTYESVGRDAVLVDQGKTVLPESQLADNWFMEAGSGPWYPHWEFERRSSFWRSFTGNMWPSGEPGWGYVDLERMRDDYAKANGKVACSNMEWSPLRNLDYLENHYQMGYQFEKFHGGKPYFRDWLRQADNIEENASRPPVHLERRLLDVNTRRDKQMGPTAQVVEVRNLTLRYREDLKFNTDMALDDHTQQGSITYRLDSKDGAFSNDLMLEIEGIIKSAEGIEIFGGTDLTALPKLATLNGHDMAVAKAWNQFGTQLGYVDMGAAMAKLDMPSTETLYLRLVFPEGGNEIWLHGIKATRRWSKQSGQLLGTPFTVNQARITQLWIQDRAVTRRLLQRYHDLAGADDLYLQAKGLFDTCRYRTAYRLLAGEISQVLPARYAVRGHGKLGRYSVEVKLENDAAVALVELMQADPSSIEFLLKSEIEQPCRLQFAELKPNRTYALEQLGINHYRLQPAKTGTVQTDKDGTATVDLEISMEEKPLPLPRTFSAIYLQGGRDGIKVWLQDPTVSLLDEGTRLPVAEGVHVSRACEGSSEPTTRDWPQALDKVEVTLDDAGRVSEMRAVYGRDRGRIKAFQKPVIRGGALSNGAIVLENGNAYELGYNYWFTRFNTLMLESPCHDPDYLAERIKPGSFIELSYCPYQHPDGHKRATVVSQPVKPLFAADFTTNSETWQRQAHSVDNLIAKAFDNSYALVPQSQGRSTGSIVFEIKADKPLDEAVISYHSRIITINVADIVFEVSDDGENWVECGRALNLERPWEFGIVRSVDISPAIQGRQRFFLRVLLSSQTGVSEAALAKLTLTGVERP
jgi:hypothetical protein